MTGVQTCALPIYWQTIYFDGFAGYGKRGNYIGDEDSFLKVFENVDKEEFFVYEGSVARILKLEKPFIFNWYYFIDTNSKYISNLGKLRNSAKHIDEKRIIIRQDNCNKQLVKFGNALHKNNKLAALIFLDPFGMQINWGSIKQLKNTRSDIWILIPAGVAVNRLLDKKKKLKHRKKLENFFGLSIEEIGNIFYNSTTENTLFGINEVTSKVNDPINKIIEIYVKQLKTIWKFVTNKPLVLKNSKNSPIFHFLFASNNQNAYKIASEIIDKEL